MSEQKIIITEQIKKYLEDILDQYHTLQTAMKDPKVVVDFTKYNELVSQMNQIKDLADCYITYKKVNADLAETTALLEEDEAEIIAFAKTEITALNKRKEQIKADLFRLLVPIEEQDKRNIIVEINGAAGGDEANIFASDLFRMYSKYAESHQWKIKILSVNESGMGGFASVSFLIKGKNVFSYLKYEAGTHRVQRVPKTESRGRIHTSTATVAVLPERTEVDVTINPKDLRIDTYRSSGAGGQHVNTTDSAVRITHLPSNIVVTSQDGRSQHDNKNLAMQHLRAKLYDYYQEQQQSEIDSLRRENIGSGDRSEKIRTYNYPQNRVTDHRLNNSWNNLDNIINGDLQEIIEQLIYHFNQQKIITFFANKK